MRNVFAMSVALGAALGVALAAMAARPAMGQIMVYLNRDGGSYTPGEPNDSRSNVSSVPDATVEVLPWDITEDGWMEVTSCVADLFGPFGVVITDEDPGDIAHVEAVIGGSPGQFGLAANAAGVSPFLSNCSIIGNSIVYVFPSVLGDDRRRVCETVAQEVAHSFGLDHQYLCEDPMSYLTNCGDKRFRFRDSRCGEFEPRACRCEATQNSARMLLERIGAGPRPELWLVEPTGQSAVSPSTTVTVAVNQTPQSVDLAIDGSVVATATPSVSGDYQVFELSPPSPLALGMHELEVVGHFAEQTRSELITINVQASNDGGLTSGCHIAARSHAGPLALVALVMVFFRRRRAAGRRN